MTTPDPPPPLDTPDARVTIRSLRRWVADGQPFAMLTCYDATTASWLWRGGIKCMLVGDTAAQVILGHDSTLPAKVPFMVELTAAVRRGAPNAFVMGDMPFGSYQCGNDRAVRNATRFLTDGGADAVKLEVDGSFAPLVQRMSHAGIPVVAHLGSRPQHVRARGGYGSVGRSARDADRIVDDVKAMLLAGASMLLIEAVPADLSRRVVRAADEHAQASPDGSRVPVIGCGAGPHCHGHVVVLQDLLGMSPWQPPFAKPLANLGAEIRDAAAQWAKLVESGQYLRDHDPYKPTP